MSTARIYTRNLAINWFSLIAGLVVMFFLSPFVVHSLGNNAYGIWVLLGSLVGYLGLLDLGVRAAVTRFIARFHAQEVAQWLIPVRLRLNL